MAQLESSYNKTTNYNRDFGSAQALQLRLETSALIENIELFLRGAKLVVKQDEQTGKITTETVSLGMSKANDLGIQAILNYISVIINPQVVQGNFPSDKKGHSTAYEVYVEETNINLVSFLINNQYNWEINDDDLDPIIDGIMAIVIPFMTRLIDNLERESFKSTITHSETSTTPSNPNKGFSLF